MSDILDLDSLLDSDLDQFEEAPEFVTPPAGAYKMEVVKAESASRGEGDKQRNVIAMTFKIAETLELSHPNADEVPATGSLYQQSWALTAEGIPYFKRDCKNVLAHIGAKNIKDALEAMKGMELMVVINTRKGKNSAGEVVTYASIANMQVV